jgi:hypothetical protein
MTEATAHLFIDVLDLETGAREDYWHVGELAHELGIRGILNRLVASRMPPASGGERVYSVLWYETLMEARVDLGRLLDGHSIPYFVFKGGALLSAQYTTGDVRMVDLDVLVPLREKERTAVAFEAAGWPKRAAAGDPALFGAPGEVFARPVTDDAISWVDMDVHWRVAPVERLFPWRGEPLPDDVWRSAVHRGGTPMPRPCHHAALLVHHLVRHDLLHFRGVFDLVQLWPLLRVPDESRAFSSLAVSLGVSRVAGRLCCTLQTDLALEPLATRAPRHSSARGPAELQSVRSLIALSLDASDKDFETVTVPRAIRRLRTVDRVLRTSLTLLTEALAPPDEYLRWRWPGANTPMRRIRHLGRVFTRLIDDESTLPPTEDLSETR